MFLREAKYNMVKVAWKHMETVMWSWESLASQSVYPVTNETLLLLKSNNLSVSDGGPVQALYKWDGAPTALRATQGHKCSCFYI